jgi:MoaA/NifB/PqqE/SkfB family radical SAM enzyme
MPSGLDLVSPVDKLADALWRRQTPYNVILELGLECNIHCAHCYQEGLREDHLPLERVLSLLDELKQEGTVFLGINGGEPTLSRKFWPIVEAASNKGFLITIYTNGTRLDIDAIRRLKELSLFEIRVSIYGTESFHNAFVRSKNAYARTTRAIEDLCASGLRVVVTTCALPDAEREAEHVRDLAARWGASFSLETTIYPKAIGVSEVGKPTAGKPIRVHRAPLSRDSAATSGLDLNSALHSRASERGVCLAGGVTCSISPSGKVMPCSMLRVPAGDVSNATFGEIWRNAALFGWFRTVDLSTGTAGGAACNGCRMAAKVPPGVVAGGLPASA